ncbi:unnamed protein product, partial [Adineta ricciae]
MEEPFEPDISLDAPSESSIVSTDALLQNEIECAESSYSTSWQPQYLEEQTEMINYEAFSDPIINAVYVCDTLSNQYKRTKPIASTFMMVNQTEGVFSYEIYMSYILSWDPAWLNQPHLKPGVLYENYCINNRSATPVRQRYTSFSDYESAHLPCLLEETWQNVKQDIQERLEQNKGKPPTICQAYMVRTEVKRKIGLMELYCQILTVDDDPMRPRYNDLLLITAFDNQQFFGILQKQQRVSNRKFIHRMLAFDPRLNTRPSEIVCIELTIGIVLKCSPLITGSCIHVQVMASLVSNLRRFRALSLLPSLPLVSELLSPSVDDMTFQVNLPRLPQFDMENNGAKNAAQYQVINEAVSIVCGPRRNSSRIYVVQGPPGTDLIVARAGHNEYTDTSCVSLFKSTMLKEIIEQLSPLEFYSSTNTCPRELSLLKQRDLEEANVVVSTLNYVGNSIFDPFSCDK